MVVFYSSCRTAKIVESDLMMEPFFIIKMKIEKKD